jgi:hypothetical protein
MTRAQMEKVCLEARGLGIDYTQVPAWSDDPRCIYGVTLGETTFIQVTLALLYLADYAKKRQAQGVIHYRETQYGFEYGAANVTRAVSDEKTGRVVLQVTTPKHLAGLQVYVTPTKTTRPSSRSRWTIALMTWQSRTL